MDVKTTSCAYKNHINTKGYFEVDLTLFERYRLIWMSKQRRVLTKPC